MLSKWIRRFPKSLPIRNQLVILGVGTLLPVMIFATLLALWLGQEQRQGALRRLTRSSRFMAATVDREISGSQRVLEALAQSDRLTDGDLDAFDAEAHRVMATQSAWMAVVLLSPDGRQLVNTLRRRGSPLPPALEVDTLREVIRTGKPAVTPVQLIRTGRWGFGVRVPVRRRGEIRYVLTAAISAEGLSEVVATDLPDQEWTRTVVDHKGVVVARGRSPKESVGRTATPSFLQHTRSTREGVYRDVSLDHAPVYVGYSRSKFANWTAAIAAPVEVVDGPLRRSMMAMGALGLLLFLLTTAGTYAFSRRVSREITAAAAAASTLADGREPALITASVAEVALLSAALGRTATLLRERERERNEQLERAESALQRERVASADLAESEANLRAAFELAAVGTVQMDPTGLYLRVNRKFCEITGYSREELLKMRDLDLTHPDDRDEDLARFQQFAVGEQDTLSTEKRYLRKDGMVVWVQVDAAIIRAPDGKPLRTVGIIQDITARREGELALRASESRCRRLVEANLIGVIETDLQGEIRAANDTFLRMVGYDREDLAAGRLRQRDLTPPEYAARDDRAIQELHERGECTPFEKAYFRKDGSQVPVLLGATAVEGETAWDETAQAIYFVVDLSERKRLEDELREQVALLEEADRRKDEFLAMLAHELRNPLTPVLNAAAVLRARGHDEPHLQRQQEIIDRQTRHLARLVDDLLDVARVSRGKIELRKEIVDLTEVLNSAVEAAIPRIEGAKHQLEVARPERPIWLQADPTRLQQMIANLLDNAAKYTPPGGHISLTVEEVESRVILRVRDSGMGITPEALPHVFELFVQGEQDLARSHGGLGIGLTLVRTLVEMHGGSVAAYSAGLGQGSEFTLCLPTVLPASSEPPVNRTGLPGVDVVPRRILVVDDNADAAETLGELLDLWGHSYQLAYSGEACLTVAREYRPDVFVLDLGMPGLDGYEVARKLQAEGLTEGALLIALTGYGQEADRQRTREAGFDFHLTKPLQPEALRDLLTTGAALLAHTRSLPQPKGSSPRTAGPDAPVLLLVEDDPELRVTLAEILEAEGYRVVGARHGEEALSYLRTGSRPSLLLLDLMMPVVNGWEFLAQYRGDPNLPELPIVVLTADHTAREKASALGVQAVLTKPVAIAQLLECLERHCTHRTPLEGYPP